MDFFSFLVIGAGVGFMVYLGLQHAPMTQEEREVAAWGELNPRLQCPIARRGARFERRRW
jgi:hypothetical protein